MKFLASASLAVVLAFLPGAVRGTEPQAGLMKQEFIYEKAPYPACHASTMAESRGALVAAWFGGYEKHPDVAIWMARCVAGKWTVPVEVANGVQENGQRYPCWNPVLFQPKKAPLMLFYKIGPSPEEWWGMLRTSTDGGKSWSEARRLPEGILGPIKNKPVQLANGDLLCPTSSEHDGWRVHFERSSDLGQTWTRTEPVNDGKRIAAIQPSILFHPEGRLQAIGRTMNGRLYEIWSEDSGRNWGTMSLTTMPNPNAGTDAITLKDGRHLLVYNHSERGRTPLNVAISRDGKIWDAALVLETEAGEEFSYPAIIQTKDELVHITYTWKRQRIRHIILNPKELHGRQMSPVGWPQ